MKHLTIILVFLSGILASSAGVDDSLAIVEYKPGTQILPKRNPDLEDAERLSTYLVNQSFAAQIADTRLIDDLFMAFDITGQRGLEWELTKFLEAERLAKGYKSTKDVINPYFFRVTKDCKSFFLLGSMHTLPLDMLPTYVQDTILSCNIFVTERGVHENEEEFQNMDAKEILKQSFSCWYDPQATWFDSLTEREQKYFQNISTDLILTEELELIKDIVAQVMEELGLTSLGLDKIKLSHVFDAFFAVHYGKGMDASLRQNFSRCTRKSLETAEEGRDSEGLLEIINSSRAELEEDDSDYDSVLEFVGNRGFLMQLEIINSSILYLLGDRYLLATIGKDNTRILRDNARWYPRLINLAKKAPIDKLLCAIGVAHLGGRDGVLYRLLTEGRYTATRYNSRDGWVPVSPADLL